VLEAVRRRPIRKLIYVSSSSVYGGGPGRLVETARLAPLTPYGVSKLAAEQLCDAYAWSMGIPLLTLRLFTVYGPGQRPDMAFRRFIDAVLREEPVTCFRKWPADSQHHLRSRRSRSDDPRGAQSFYGRGFQRRGGRTCLRCSRLSI
jgi:hypothetical protein